MIIGIYGNIGSGKTTTANYIKNEYNYHLIELDKIAKDELKHNDDLKQELKNLKQEHNIDVFMNIDSNEIDSNKMRKYIFGSFKNNYLVSLIIWKYIKKDVDKMTEELLNNNIKNIIIEAAMLPFLKINHIDFYIKMKSTKNFIKIKKDKNINFKEFLNINKIQNKYNKFNIAKYNLKSNKNLKLLYKDIDEIMKKKNYN